MQFYKFIFDYLVKLTKQLGCFNSFTTNEILMIMIKIYNIKTSSCMISYRITKLGLRHSSIIKRRNLK